MTMRTSATFVDGVLKPDDDLELPDQARVSVVIEPLTEARDAVAAWNALKERIRERPIHGGGRRYSRDDLHERTRSN